MPKDFAKRAATQEPANTSSGGGVKIAWFASGMLVGMFVSFLFYLWQFVPEDPSAKADKPTAQIISDKKIIEMDYDFYDLFPSAEVPIVEEYTTSGEKVVVEEDLAYLLQAGSFRNKEDAERLRGELILQGLEVFVRTVEQANGGWHRVMVGPFDTKLELTRTRNVLAEANIESIPIQLKR
ncbi:MAG: cell division protein FtsN [Candidatus Azotimanducaceae bacterium]|jgi:cell division protein FtsN